MLRLGQLIKLLLSRASCRFDPSRLLELVVLCMRLQGVRDMLEVTEGHNVLAHLCLYAVLWADFVTGGLKDDASASDPHFFYHALDTALAILIVLSGLMLLPDLFALLESGTLFVL